MIRSSFANPSFDPVINMLPIENSPKFWSPGKYTLPKKKCKFNVLIIPDAPGFLTLIQGHVDFGCARTMRNFGMGYLANCYQEHSTK